MKHESKIVLDGNKQLVVLLPVPIESEPELPERWNTRSAKGIGITLIVLAVAVIACNIAWFFLFPGVGLMAGAVLLVTGVLLTASGFRPSRCLIISVRVMSISTVIIDLAFIIVGAMAMTLSHSGEMNLAGVLYVFIGILCFGLLALFHNQNPFHSKD